MDKGQKANAMDTSSNKNKDSRQGTESRFEDDIHREAQPFGSIKDSSVKV